MWGAISGSAIALIFYLRMRMEEALGKAFTRQAFFAGFETEDVLYVLPLITLCNATAPFLLVAAICAPLFAAWVTLDYGRALRTLRRRADHLTAMPGATAAAPDSVAPEQSISSRLADLDPERLRGEFAAQGAFLYVEDFLPREITAQLIAAIAALQPAINRNYLPAHKQGGSVSRHAIDQYAPFIAGLYRSPALLRWLAELSGERLQFSPDDDPHAYALYFYTRPGDHIGWHYDNSYYAGRRYTLLFGIIDESSCRLDYQLHTREPGATVVPGSVKIPAGGLVFFDGDALRHRISPLGEGEIRVSLTFEYLTDTRMHPWWRLISNLKDAFAYFGFRQVFRRTFSRRGG
jgi:hypothetical protein